MSRGFNKIKNIIFDLSVFDEKTLRNFMTIQLNKEGDKCYICYYYQIDKLISKTDYDRLYKMFKGNKIL